MTDTADQIVIPVPGDYDEDEEAAFRAGFQTCAQLFGQAATTYVNAAAAGSDSGDDEDSEDDECPECGGELVSSFGGHRCLQCGYVPDAAEAAGEETTDN